MHRNIYYGKYLNYQKISCYYFSRSRNACIENRPSTTNGRGRGIHDLVGRDYGFSLPDVPPLLLHSLGSFTGLGQDQEIKGSLFPGGDRETGSYVSQQRSALMAVRDPRPQGSRR